MSNAGKSVAFYTHHYAISTPVAPAIR